MPMVDAFRMADQVLYQGVDGITSLITTPGLINLDFADVKSVMAGAGSALMGIGIGSGADRADGGRQVRDLEPAARVLDRRRQGRPAVDRRPDRPVPARGERGGRRDHPRRAPRREHHLRRGRRRRAGRRGPRHGRRAGFDKVALSPDNRFESRLSRLLEEPVRTGARRSRSRRSCRTTTPTSSRPTEHPRRSRSTPRRTWTSPTSSRADDVRRPARPRAQRGGEVRAQEAPFPRLLAERLLPAPSRMLRRHAGESRDGSAGRTCREIGEASPGVAAGRAGRDASAVDVSLAAAKTVAARPIRWARRGRCVARSGDNYVRELRARERPFRTSSVRWHFIGALQSRNGASGRRPRRRRADRERGAGGAPARRPRGPLRARPRCADRSGLHGGALGRSARARSRRRRPRRRARRAVRLVGLDDRSRRSPPTPRSPAVVRAAPRAPR